MSRSSAKEGIVHSVMNSFFPPIVIILFLAFGVVSLWLTPKEEDPQIVVPMADVLIEAPGLSAQQVEKQVTEPLEKLLSQIDGVEYVYSSSLDGEAQVIVRFFVGEPREAALVKLYNKLYSNQDRIPPSVTSWLVKPVELDDVPIVVAALYSTDANQIDRHDLKRIADQATLGLKSIPSTNGVEVVGGETKVVAVELDSVAMASFSITLRDLNYALSVSHTKQKAGSVQVDGKHYLIESGRLLKSAKEVGNLVVAVVNNKPVFLRDIAKVTEQAREATTDTWYLDASDQTEYPAVFISVAKQKGSNAVAVAKETVDKLHALQQQQFPSQVKLDIIRNYGKTADDKVTNLVSSLGIAVVTVVVFVGLFLNWRSALVVGIAIPLSYGAALGLDLLFGYTINRVTLFALILALGLIVDDPIASIDNIERYLKRKDLSRSKAIVLAMAEIRSALIMSTVAIVIVFTPMFFITGMMGPYMAPLAFNVPVSVIISTVVAFFVTPWLAKKILKAADQKGHYDFESSPLYQLYARILTPLLTSRKKSWLFLTLIAALFIGAAILPALRLVPLKLLPYDNKNEFQLVLNMPEYSNFVDTSNALRVFADYLVTVPEVKSVSGFAGVASPMDFNGMVRHYFMRNRPNQGELRVVLADKDQRAMQSHEIVTRVRSDIEDIAHRYDASIQLVEVPPGPPVIATITAEVYGEEHTSYDELMSQAKHVATRLNQEAYVTEVDTSVDDKLEAWQFIIDQEKAALSGVSIEEVNETIAAANNGLVIGQLASNREVSPVAIEIKLPRNSRDDLDHLLRLYVRGQAGVVKSSINGSLVDAPQPLVQLGEIGRFEKRAVHAPIYHKNLKPVVYVYAETAGRVPGEIIADVIADLNRANEKDWLDWNQRTYFNNGSGKSWSVDEDIEVVWSGEGEWKITVDVFRDLGIAYGVALFGVFIVMLVQTGLPAVAGIIMLAIPLTVIGIMPGFWLLNSLSHDINGYPNPALFTATAMIGMIALAGIVVRNSLVLIEFIQQSLTRGEQLHSALIQSGAVRMRPILLTAGTTLLGNIIITLDPIFNGLAWAIIFGIAASTVFTLLVIPVVYNLAYERTDGHGLPFQCKHAHHQAIQDNVSRRDNNE